jgi:hypothetical protein
LARVAERLQVHHFTTLSNAQGCKSVLPRSIS